MYTPDIHSQIDLDQGYHRPDDAQVVDHLAEIRRRMTEFNHWLADAVPANRHRDEAVKLIDQAQMYAIKACVTDQNEVVDLLEHRS